MADEAARSTRKSCPVTYALETFGDRWTLQVLQSLILEGHRRFKEIQEANPKMATNILSERLQRLENRGLVEKTTDPGDARRYIYTPTDGAIALIPMLLEMMVWSTKFGDAKLPETMLKQYSTNREALIKELETKATEI